MNVQSFFVFKYSLPTCGVGEKSKNTTLGNIQTEKSVYATKVYPLVNIQNKDRDFSF